MGFTYTVHISTVPADDVSLKHASLSAELCQSPPRMACSCIVAGQGIGPMSMVFASLICLKILT